MMATAFPLRVRGDHACQSSLLDICIECRKALDLGPPELRADQLCVHDVEGVQGQILHISGVSRVESRRDPYLTFRQFAAPRGGAPRRRRDLLPAATPRAVSIPMSAYTRSVIRPSSALRTRRYTRSSRRGRRCLPAKARTQSCSWHSPPLNAQSPPDARALPARYTSAPAASGSGPPHRSRQAAWIPWPWQQGGGEEGSR